MNLYWRTRRHAHIQGRPTAFALSRARRPLPGPPSLTIDELEAGLRVLDRIDTDHTRFWQEKGCSFMVTIQRAIRETAEALLFQEMPEALRIELEAQLAWLEQFAQKARVLGASTPNPHVQKMPTH